MSNKITHGELCHLGSKMLRNSGHSVVLQELVSVSSECPDLLAFKGGHSVMIEVKVSRADFRNDFKKWFRREENRGMGAYRYYMAPKDIIPRCEVPKGWGLIEVDQNRKKTYTIGDKLDSCFYENMTRFDRNIESEQAMLLSVIRRIKKADVKNRNFKIFIKHLETVEV